MAVVTGGASRVARELALALARWDWAIVVVYLEHQRRAEAAVDEILAAAGSAVAVRADLADDLDVQRLFLESTAAFGSVDVVAHTTTQDATVLLRYAACRLQPGGVIVTVSGAGRVAPDVARVLRERDIGVGRAPPDGQLAFLERWRRG